MKKRKLQTSLVGEGFSPKYREKPKGLSFYFLKQLRSQKLRIGEDPFLNWQGNSTRDRSKERTIRSFGVLISRSKLIDLNFSPIPLAEEIIVRNPEDAEWCSSSPLVPRVYDTINKPPNHCKTKTVGFSLFVFFSLSGWFCICGG